MSQVRRHTKHALTALIAWSLVTGALVGLGAGTAEARVPKAAARYTAAIEPLAGYVGQSTCSPAAKPGTAAFANLLLRTYRNSRSLGISRSCGVGGKSEHKEGRAFDWGVNVRSKADRASVKALMHWLLKRDRFGNRYAMARRLGIQYMIWNRRIWGAYSAGSGWRKYTGSNPHTDHVHFSMSWAGARKKTSFWNPRSFPNNSGSAPSRPGKPKPKPTPAVPTRPSGQHDYPHPTPDERRTTHAIPEPRAPRTLEGAAPLVAERVSVPSARRAGIRTQKALVAGHRYLIEVSGSYKYANNSGSAADAECSTRSGASWWQRDRSLRADEWYADHLDLYVDGHDLMSEADDSEDCDSGHTYRWVYEAERSGRVPFAIWDPENYQDNSGRLSVRVLDLATSPDSMSWSVPARNKAGATSPGLLRGGQDYLVTVSGTWKNGTGGIADAECLATDDGWRRDADAYDMVAGEWRYDSLSPRISGVRATPAGGGSECDAEHTYSWVHHADRTTPLNVRVSDPDGFDDNTGALKVKVELYDGSSSGAAPAPAPLPVPETVAAEELSVDSASKSPVRTAQEYAAGTKLRVAVKGTYLMRASSSGWIAADAECSIASWDQQWRSSRREGLFNGRTTPLGDLAVNGSIVDWAPADGAGSCDTDNVYSYDLTTSKAGPLSFVVADDEYGDNKGALEVTVEMR